ncbi:hypothetical protein [Candidatus Tisiphia endosymbiont of Hybos culiciformis]|uniref:hypothetical protein n=1 Tax=Candidatus Tisiphia endosymbiont of Hybos culiciformis TaxID=3139331 RepID=UPI003CCAC19F
MKSGNEDNKEGLTVVNEAVNNIAEAVIAVHNNLPASSAEKQDLEGVAEVLVDVMTVLDRSSSLQDITAKDIEGLEKKAENMKSRSSIGAKIKAWFNSFINFLKSPFSKQHKEELQQATKDTVKEIEVVQKQAVKEQALQEQIATTIPAKETHVQPPLMETDKPQTTIARTAPLAVPETTHPIQDIEPVQAVVGNAPTMPPSQVTTVTPIVMPPPVQVTVNIAPGVPPPPPPPPPPAYVAQSDPLAAIKSMEKKSPEQIAELAKPTGGDLINELEKRLAARKEKAGEIQIDEKSPKHLQELAAIRKLSEKDRLGEKEAVYGQKIEVAIKPEAAAVSPPKVVLKDGVPVAPPPPPPPPPMPATQPPKPVVTKSSVVAAPATKGQAKPVQLAVDAEALKNAMGNFRKVASSPPKETTEKPVPNFKAHLKPIKGHGGRE